MTALNPHRSQAAKLTRPQALVILQRQGYVCVYCAMPFGSVVSRQGRKRTTSVQYDHFIPLSYLGHSPTRNWVAACDVCNGIKSDLMFRSVNHARLYILERWTAKGYSLEWRAPCSCEKNPSRWAVNFATYLAGLPRGLAQTVEARYPSKRMRITMRDEVRMADGASRSVATVPVGDLMIEVGMVGTK